MGQYYMFFQRNSVDVHELDVLLGRGRVRESYHQGKARREILQDSQGIQKEVVHSRTPPQKALLHDLWRDFPLYR